MQCIYIDFFYVVDIFFYRVFWRIIDTEIAAKTAMEMVELEQPSKE